MSNRHLSVICIKVVYYKTGVLVIIEVYISPIDYINGI